MSTQMHTVAKVMLWGETVGALVFDGSSGFSAFEYSPQWLKDGFDIAPIHMPLSKKVYVFPHLAHDTYKGLPAIFADSLPDDFGNSVINAWLAQEGRDPQSFSPLERLLYNGTRGMGALDYLPSIDSRPVSKTEIKLDSLIAMAQGVLDRRNEALGEISAESNEPLNDLLQVGTSAGGARPKALIAINKARTKIRSGQVDAPKNYEHFLLKFDGVAEQSKNHETFGDPKGFGRAEYAYYLMAQDCGINISESELLEENGRAHFMTKRFDRDGNRKLHYVSLCAMAHADFNKAGHYSYEELIQVARTLQTERNDAIDIYRRMVFNVLARNQDDHTKNFGFLYCVENDVWDLAPAFDLAYSYKPDSKWVNAHQLSIAGKRDNFTRDDLLSVYKNVIGKDRGLAIKILQEVNDVVQEWPAYARVTKVEGELSSLIHSNQRLGLL